MRMRKGQQEMVGFVLIVIIVIVGILVFLVFTLRQDEVSENDIVNNVLSAILKTTSSCSIGSERNYNDMNESNHLLLSFTHPHRFLPPKLA